MATTAPRLDLIRTADALKINPLTRQPPGHCTHIYAYAHIRTNQVLYSLTRLLSPRKPLRQLPEAGNNTKPPNLRKDLWRPLWTLSLPPGFQGEAQGLEAWKRLNALRYMHEIYWTPPKDLSRVRSPEELEEIYERIEDRGGSKRESVYQVLRREKKKLRLRGVMDQKANSIADLAAVLVEQEALSLQDPGRFGAREVRRMMRLDEKAQKGAIERLEVRIAGLGRRIKELEKVMPGSKGNPDALDFRKQRALRYKIRKGLREAQELKAKLEYAVLMVSYGELTPDALAERELREEEERLLFEGPQQDPVLEAQRVRALLRHGAIRAIVKATKSSEQQDAFVRWTAVQQAREILIPVHEGEDSLSPEQASQLRTYRVRTLEDTIQSHTDRIATIKDQIKDLKAQEGPKEEVEALQTEQYRLAAQIRVWKAMIDAYELTRGTLELAVPETGVVWHIGTHPRTFTTKDGQAVAKSEQPDLEVAKEAELELEEAEFETAEIEARDAAAATSQPSHQDAAAEGEGEAETQEPSTSTSPSAEIEEPTPAEIEAEGENYAALPPSERPPIIISKPAFSMSGVKVSWQNILDAEFAPTWPATVQHQWMGITRHSAPKPDKEPALDAMEFWKGKLRPSRWEKEKGDRDVRRDVVESVSAAVIRELIGKNKDKSGGKKGKGVGLVGEGVEKEKVVVKEI